MTHRGCKISDTLILEGFIKVEDNLWIHDFDNHCVTVEWCSGRDIFILESSLDNKRIKFDNLHDVIVSNEFKHRHIHART